MDIPVTVDETEAGIIANMVTTLENLTNPIEARTQDAGRLFDSVVVVENAQDFMQSTDVLGQSAAAVVVGASERQYPTDNGLDFEAAINLPVIIRLLGSIEVDFDESVERRRLATLAQSVRKGLLVDKSRGGLAWARRIGGKFIDHTSVDGRTSIINNRARNMTMAIQIPVVVAWAKNMS